MELNLFYSLFKYRPTSDREPLEDYFTELVGFLFNFNKQFAAKWIRFISEGNTDPDPETIDVSTQFPLGKYGRADLIFRWTENNKTRTLLMEHKISSPIGEKGADESGARKTQIDNYLQYQSEMGDAADHKVALFKLSPQQTCQSSSPHFLDEFTWDKFDEFIKSQSKFLNNPETNFLCDQISKFMRRFNMVFDNFTIQNLASSVPYNEFRIKISQLTEKIKATFEGPSEIFKGILKYPPHKGWGEKVVAYHWGLIIYNKDGPANSNIWIHFGFSEYFDEKGNYPPTTLREQRIPDVQAMIALWTANKNIEKVKITYGSIQEKLNTHLRNIGISENRFEVIEGNGFVSFCFRKPLTDFLKYKNQESEVIKFLEFGFKAISHLLEQGILLKLCNDDCLK